MNEDEQDAPPSQETPEIQEPAPAPEPKRAKVLSARDAWSPTLASARRSLLLLAWLVALVVGWQSAPVADLLEGTVRGALAWLGTWLIGNLGISLAERILTPSEQSDAPLTM